MVGTAVAIALFGGNDLARAQQQPVQAQQQPDANASSNPQSLQEVVVTGIRYSLTQSMQIKRAAVGTIDVVTAESIGKLPDKNVADAIQRLPGVNISSAGANEGGFDEDDRVSLRGTSPSLTQTMINGHLVGSGDWFVLDQTGTVGRSVSYTLLPADIVKEVKVYKSSQASLLEGGVAGTVDIITRKPLDFPDHVTLNGSVGAEHSSLPDTSDPEASFLGNWVNGDRTFGTMLQLFSQTRHLRRDGEEILGYDQFSAKNTPAIVAADPDLNGVMYPHDIDVAYFTQERKKDGGLLEFQYQPTDTLSVDLSGFYSKMNASDFNRSYLLWTPQFIGASDQAPLPGYVVQNNTLVSANFAAVPGNNYGVYDQISRPNEGSSTSYEVLSANWKPLNALSVYGELGVTEGHGYTPTQDVAETNTAVGTGGGYTLHGITTGPSWNLGTAINNTPTPNGVPVAFGWIFGDNNYDVTDAEKWGQIDGTFALNDSVFTDFKFGARFANHDRHLWGAIGQGPLPGTTNPSYYPDGAQNFPSNFGYGLGSGFPTNIWYWTPEQLAAYAAQTANRDPVTRADYSSDYGVHEKDYAVYFQADVGGNRWSGNAGVRFVRTKESDAVNVGVPAPTATSINTSAFGDYETQTINNSYNNVLPSGNLKFDLTKDLVARLDAAITMTRPDYSALAGSTSLEDAPAGPGSVGSGTGGNPYLKPITSDNVDAGLEWYFAPRSLVSAELFYMKLKNYVAFGSTIESFFTQNGQYPNGFLGQYNITTFNEADGRVQGVELAYQQPFFQHFGADLNFTLADGKQTSDLAPGADDRLVGTSKDTGNAIVYFENKKFSARVAYTYRSSFLNGEDRSTAFSQGPEGTWAASLGYTVNEHFNLSLDGLNLNNPELKYYAANTSQPRAFYRNGAEYYLDAHFTF